MVWPTMNRSRPGRRQFEFDDAVDYQPGYMAEGYYDPLRPDVEGGFACLGTTFGVELRFQMLS